MFRTIDPVALTTLQRYEHRQLLHRARWYIYIKGAVNAAIVLLFWLTFPPELRPRMVAIVLIDALLLIPYWFLVQRYPTLATSLSLGITSLAISAGDWAGGYQTGASGILYALLILGGHLVLIKPRSTYLIFGLTAAIYVGTIALEVNGLIPIHFPFTLSNLLRVVSLNVISMFGLTILTRVVTRLYRELLQRNKELFALNTVSVAASQSLNLDKVLHLTLDRVLEVMNLDEGGLYLLEASTGEMVLKAHRTLAEESVGWVPNIKIGIEGLTDLPFGTGQVLVVDDLSQHPMMSEIVSDGNGHRPLAIVPLKAQDKILGVMNLLGRAGYAFASQDVELLNTIGAQTGMAIERAQFLEKEQKRSAQLTVVNQVARQIASILDLDQLLYEVVTDIQQSFNYHHVGLFLLDEVTGQLEMQAVAGSFADVAPPDHRLALGEGIAGWTAETGQPFLANDVSQEPRYVLGILKETLTKAELCVPLKLAGKVIGVLDVQDTQLNAFDETDLLAMETLADQLAIAIENARLFRETKLRLEEIMALYQTSLDITAQIEMTELLKSIVERAATLLQAEGGGICLYDPEREELRWIIGYGHGEEYVGTIFKPGEGMAGKVFQTGEPLMTDDYQTWEGRAALYEADQPFTAILEMPLKWQDRTIGVLAINADAQKRTFNHDDVWLATLLANQAAIAIENARIYEEERKRATQLELISGITQRMASILDLDELLHQVAHLIKDTFDYSDTSILLVEANTGEILLKATTGPSGRLVEKLRLRVGQKGITGWVAHSGEPLLANDVSREPRYHFREETKDIKSELAVPIKLKGEIIGVLDAQSIELDAFSQDDVSILQTLADQLAIAIENARLYQQTDEKLQTRVKELSVLYAIAEAVNHSLDLDKVLQLALDSAVEVARMDSGGILLFDPSTSELFLRAHRRGSLEFLRALSHVTADEDLMPRMLNSVLTIDDLSKVTKDRRVAIEKEGLQSLVSIPLKAKENLLGVMVIASHSPRPFASQELELLAAIGNQIGVAVDRANLQVQKLRAAILEERQDMARQMHDDTAQTLGSLGLQVDSVMGNPSLAHNVKVQVELEGIRKAIEDAYERVRSFIIRLGKDLPDHFDLETALPEIISEFEKQTRCRVESSVEGGQLPRLPPAVALQAIHIIREALTNVRKHSGATSVHLTIQGLEDGRVKVTIQDNGRGFDLDSDQQADWRGFGLRFMRERAERAGGSLRIESQPGQGTRVVVSLPSG